MRVLFWSDLFWPYLGGIERLGAALLPALTAHGHQFRVVTSHHTLDLADLEVWEGITVHRLPFRAALGRPDPATVLRARQGVDGLFRAFRPQLVHIYGLGPSAVFYARAAAGRATPLLLSLHQELLSAHGRGAQTLLRELLERAAWIHAVSRPVLRQACALLPAVTRRSSVIVNFVEAGPKRPTPLPAAPPRLLCLGRLIPPKGFDLALEAFARIRARLAHARLVVAGDGSDRPALERLAGDLGIATHVEFTGWVRPADVSGLLDQSTAVLMPSRREGLGLVAVEAALRARPVVAAAVGGVPDVVVHGRTGLLVEPGNAPVLAEAAAGLLADPAAARRMGRAARRRARVLFDKERCVTRYAALYARLEAGVTTL